MKNTLLVFASLLVAAGIYTRMDVHAQDQPEYEFTVVETAGLIGEPAAATANSVTKTYFRRADGTTGSMFRETRNGNTATTASYKSPKENAEIVTVVGRGSRVTYPVPHETVQLWLSPPYRTDCAKHFEGVRKLGESRLSGVTVEKLSTVNAIEEAEYYIAPSLGCATLKAYHRWKDASGAFVSWTDVELVGLKLGPPDASYFDLHLGARELRPSELRAEVRAVLYPGEPMPACYERGNVRMDAGYERARNAAAEGWAVSQASAPGKTPQGSR